MLISLSPEHWDFCSVLGGCSLSQLPSTVPRGRVGCRAQGAQGAGLSPQGHRGHRGHSDGVGQSSLAHPGSQGWLIQRVSSQT